MNLSNTNKHVATKHKTALILGNFDGVHRGHQKLISKMIEIARIDNLKPSILLFENHTKTLLDGKGPELITSIKQKKNLLLQYGVENIYTLEFDNYIRKLQPEDFFIEILLKRLNVGAIVVGFNYTFGYRASGNTSLLMNLCKKYDVQLVILDPIYINKELVSSTKIRENLKIGNLKIVKTLLGRDYSILGKVVPGKRVGRKLGFPTANIQPLVNYITPKRGVYASNTIVNSKFYHSATSVGYNPTFNEESIKIETHIIDFNEDIYNNTIEIIFKEYLREETKFESTESLKKQILEDISRVKRI